jgi:hypothetical protein
MLPPWAFLPIWSFYVILKWSVSLVLERLFHHYQERTSVSEIPKCYQLYRSDQIVNELITEKFNAAGVLSKIIHYHTLQRMIKTLTNKSKIESRSIDHYNNKLFL